MTEYVKCIDTTNSCNLLINKIYEVVDVRGLYYLIKDDTGLTQHYYKYRFEKYPKGVNMNETRLATNEAISLSKVRNRNWIVGSIDKDGDFSFSANPSPHTSETAAKLEAQRLAAKFPEKTYIVAQLRAGFKTQTITEI